MALTTGTRLGPYEILDKLGAGGMGEVYRARDSKLGRDVAIKVLPEALARDPERLARFRREATLLAFLNHSHIASIYGLEDSGPRHALVMELAEGPTLADRLAQGPIPWTKRCACRGHQQSWKLSGNGVRGNNSSVVVAQRLLTLNRASHSPV